MINKFVRGRVSIFIDAANLENSVKDLGWWIKYKKFYDYFNRETTLTQIKYYCVRHNTESQDRFFTFLKKTGFQLITKPLKTILHYEDNIYRHLRKANFDVEIALDAYIQKDNYDTFILFSGDSDFKYLIEILKGKNKRIIVVSSKYHVSRELVEAANKYIDLKELEPFIKKEDK
jgi:uncharacterized LabA/DUF88 family protein